MIGWTIMMPTLIRSERIMDSTDAVARRRTLAVNVAAAYAGNPKVAGVVLAGSVARGLADGFSDVEVDVFWHSAPSLHDRHAPLEANAWILVSAEEDEDEWADSFMVDGVKVDTSQFLVSTLDRWIDKVMQTGDTEPEYQVRITAVRQGRPLHNAALIGRWRSKTEPYPDVLANAMVTKGLEFWPRGRIEMLAARGDVVMLHSDLVDNVRGILDALMGASRLYVAHPWHKWLDWETGQLTITPPDLNARIRRLLTADPTAAAAQTTALVHETFDLVDRYVKGFDTGALRAAFEHPRVVS
jgi:predicted nucleotidyltransferase